MSDHEHDEEGNCIIPQDHPLHPGGLPTWRFSAWDAVGIFLTGVGGMFSVVGQAANLLARECNAMANWKRNRFDVAEEQELLEAQREAMALDYERLTGIDTLWLADEPRPEDTQ